jgi:alpha-tubulin suppressor-like RCC1 family protein
VRLAAALAPALLAWGCQDPTEIVVHVDAASELRLDGNALHLEVLPLRVDESRDPIAIDASATALPTSLTLVPKTVDETRFLLTAEIVDTGGAAIARARVLTSFVPGESRALFVLLVPGGTDCGERETWDGVQCIGACATEPERPRPPDGRPTATGRCDATCAAAEDGELCTLDGMPGRCWSQACCLGCWDGEACVTGESASACGARGGECEACDTEPPCSDRCVGQQCVPAEPVATVGAGRDHTCASASSVHCWGGNAHGQLGTGEISEREEMTRVFGTGAFDIAAGDRHTCVIEWNRRVACWGANDVGQLGDGTGADRPRPPTGDELEMVPAGWLELSSSLSTTCAIRDDGSERALHCWGQNAAHQAAQPGPVDSSVILSRSLVASPDGWKDVASGHKHGAAIDGAGRLFTWGGVALGEPTPDYSTIVRPPDDVTLGYVLRDASGGRTWRSVAAARFGTCGIDAGGALFCSGQLKESLFPGVTSLDRWALELVARGPVLGVAQGFDHVCFIEEDGSLHCAGSNKFGALGVRDAAVSEVRLGPVGSQWVSVAVGFHHSCALRTSGALYCWGVNDFGQIGGSEPQVRELRRICIPPP